MSPYEAWNLRLLREYFPDRSQGEEVFLDTSPERLEALGPDLGGDTGFLAAVGAGPPWRLPDSFVGKVHSLVQQRTGCSRRPPGYIDPGRLDPTYRATEATKSAPAYLPLLAAMARAAATAGGDGYYAQLRRDLALPDGWGALQMAKIVDVWDDLEAWTKATQGRFGSFKRRVVGNHRLVGLPRSQIIIAARDIPALERFFSVSGLSPGQQLDNNQFNELVQSIPQQRSGQLTLSAALRDAAARPEFRDLLRVRLESILDEWDGVTAEGSANGIDNGAGDYVAGQIGLILGEGNHLPWRARIHVADGSLEGEGLGLCDGSRRWELSSKAGAGMVSAPADVASHFLHGLQSKCFDLCEGRQSDNQLVARRHVRIGGRLLSVLVGRESDSGNWELVEGPLPAFGGAYLLACPDGRNGLAAYLEREKPVYQEVPAEGLPKDWRLVYLEGQDLKEGQRTLPDGLNRHAKPRPIRLEGGVSVRRGGMRAFLPYDLPTIVLDAPASAVLECTLIGVETLHAPAEASGVVEGVPIGSALRRYRLAPAAERGGVFHLSVKLDGRVLGRATLRVRPSDSATLATPGDVSLDETGRVQGGIDGLFGGLGRLDDSHPWGTDMAVPSGSLGSVVGGGARFDSIGVCFLDALAEAGAMAYGRARDLVVRLSAAKGLQLSASDVIQDLWARGHLEVTRSNRGHFERVYAVPPAAYLLPATVEGARTFGILGTPTIAQWTGLANGGIGWSAYLSNPGSMLPAFRLRSHWSDDKLASLLQGAGFGLLKFQGLAIARWSADSNRMQRELADARYEAPVANAQRLGKFSLAGGCFNPCDRMRTPDGEKGPELLLYRMLDQDTGAHWLHVSATPSGYAFAWDARWAVWLALKSYCRFLAMLDPIVFGDLERWPLSYDESTRELWLPACLRLPTVLERAAVLCFGDSPESYDLCGEQADGKVVLRLASSGTEVRRVSSVYAGMANGRWLRYRWLPQLLVDSILR